MEFVFVFLFFVQLGVPVYDPPRLFYDIYNTINEHTQRPTHYLSSMFLTKFDIEKEVIEKVLLQFHLLYCFIYFICFISIIFMLSLFECITRSSSVPLEEIILIASVNAIFYVSYISGLFIISFKYGLILLRYFSIDSALFLSLLLSYSI